MRARRNAHRGALRIGAVPREVVASARALTGAACGVIATADEAGRPRDFVTSGLTQAQHRTMEAWPDGLRRFGRLDALARPLRLPDLDAWTRSLGFPPFPVPCGAFQATPMRHRGAAAGGFFLGGKEGGFTDADEAMPVVDDDCARRRVHGTSTVGSSGSQSCNAVTLSGANSLSGAPT